ncbi:NPC1 [Cordylochernes scorpioides]|uniref:NPC1 n=1 Tax=Cordylochernes scorpioides TaxID=51811 RepID=A0ABY6L4B4_9ARAC|nr:NPC1 [Cordylochernes scorpioides]
MPAVRTFALFAGMALFTDLVLQMSTFVACLALDARRKGLTYLQYCAVFPGSACTPCGESVVYETNRPKPEYFTQYAQHFLNDIPNPKCAVGIFYVFYEQYLTIWSDTLKGIGMSIGAILAVTLIMTGFDFEIAIFNTLTILSIIVNLMGLMYWWSIPLNAVSLVNLIMGAGISVEFCSHISRTYLLAGADTRKEAARQALAKMGSSVLSGITFTKFGGIFILYFAKSQIFEVFYFRMYAGIVLCGATHGLILLPVILSFFGNLFLHLYLITCLSCLEDCFLP